MNTEQKTFRSLLLNGEEFEFSNGFTDLHTQSYRKILEGKGFGVDEVKSAIQTVYEIRNASPIGLKGNFVHPFCESIGK